MSLKSPFWETDMYEYENPLLGYFFSFIFCYKNVLSFLPDQIFEGHHSFCSCQQLAEYLEWHGTQAHVLELKNHW